MYKKDLDGSGSLSIEEFMSLPELQQNPLVRWIWLEWSHKTIDARRVIDIFDDDGNGEVDFKEFIMGLSHFRFMESSRATMLVFVDDEILLQESLSLHVWRFWMGGRESQKQKRRSQKAWWASKFQLDF